MSNQLCTVHYLRVCLAYFLLFASLYMLLPIFPFEMMDKLNITFTQGGFLFLLFALGMYILGPFYAFIVDAYKRKSVCKISILLMLLTTFSFSLATNYIQLILLCILYGAAFGVATMSLITIGIDIMHTKLRSKGNHFMTWISRFGMIIGMIAGVLIYHFYSFQWLIYASILLGGISIVLVSRVYLPFRAPMQNFYFTTDRFILLRGWLPALNLLILALLPGLLIPLLCKERFDVNDILQLSVYFLFTLVGYVISSYIVGLQHKREKINHLMISGIVLILLALGLLRLNIYLTSALPLGLGLGIIASEFILLFFGFTEHCQRATVNTTYLLVWETGFGLGVFISCWLIDTYNNQASQQILNFGIILCVIALLFYVLITYPYFKRKKIR